VTFFTIARKVAYPLFLAMTLAIAPHAALAAERYAEVSTEAIGQRASIYPAASAVLPSTLSVTFALKSAGVSDVSDFVNSLSEPSSPNHHKWLTPKEFGLKFGANQSDIDAITSYLSQNGFTGIKVWSNRLFVTASVGASAAQALFQLNLNSYVRSPAEIAKGYSRAYYAPDREPKVDVAIAGKLSGIFGLSNAGQHRANFVRPFSVPNASDGALNPSDLALIYNGEALHAAGFEGKGETIAIFSPTTYSSSDVNAFLSANNLNANNINIVAVNGGTRDSSNLEEADIDIETVAGQAPGANINVYEGPNDGSLDIFNRMADDDPAIVTESYGSDENSVTASFAASYETLRQQMAAEGITILVASGDNGAYDSINQITVTVSVDASSAYVTSIGGTELDHFTNDWWNGEVAWTYNDDTLGPNAGSGGGLSIYYQEPSWQTGPGVSNTLSNGMRQIPDISSIASTPYYNLYVQGAFASYGGTSCACQFLGATMALIDEQLGTKLGNINPSLYKFGADNAAIYHDITSGNNGVYHCAPNWDFVTGWGSPDIAKLVLALSGTTVAAEPIHTFTSGLQMFSVPYYFVDSETSGEILNGLVSSSGETDYEIAAWNPSSAEYAVSPMAPATTTSPGIGYWGRFGTDSIGALYTEGVPVASSTYAVSLVAGWNLVGNPYTSNVSVDSLQITNSAGLQSLDSAAAAGIVQPSFYDYDGTNYVSHNSGDVIASFDGYWIYAFQNCTLTFTSP